jgi:uncharacterized membrane protein YidH (DUF202 family)
MWQFLLPGGNDMKVLKIVLVIIGALLALFGIVWFLQGINVLAGTMMSGKPLWVIIGVIAFIAGIVINLVIGLKGNKGKK